jgi:inosine/xanthosine triphosphatase
MITQNVVIASLNPAKIKAVQSAFTAVFPEMPFEFIGVSVSSGVAEQPVGDDETRQGALNRVSNAKQSHPNADFFVGLEAGIEGGSTFAWMIIESDCKRGESRSSSLQLPPVVTAQLNAQTELGTVMDNIFNTSNIKQKGGAISLLTNGLLTRSSVYHQALVLALIPFAHPELFPENLPLAVS